MALIPIRTQTDGLPYTTAWANLLKRALAGIWAPRSGDSPSDESGSLGNATTSWLDAIVQKFSITKGGRVIGLKSGAASNYTLTLPDAPPSPSRALHFDNTGQGLYQRLATSAFSNAVIGARTKTRTFVTGLMNSLLGSGTQIGYNDIIWFLYTTIETGIGCVSPAITLPNSSGRPVLVMVAPSTVPDPIPPPPWAVFQNYNFLYMDGGQTNPDCYWRLYRVDQSTFVSTLIAKVAIGVQATYVGPYYFKMPPGGIWFVDETATPGATYKYGMTWQGSGSTSGRQTLQLGQITAIVLG